MKRIVLLLGFSLGLWVAAGVLTLVLTLSSCVAPEAAVLPSVGAAWGVIGPEYRAYLEADPSLSPESKVTRKRTAELLSQAIAEGLTPEEED